MRDYPPTAFSLQREVVHLWRSPLIPTADRLTRYYQWLSPDEAERANRFYRDRDRHRFILARGGLRAILGRYLQCPPAQVQLAYGSHGKPTLAPAFAATRLQFNLSHSETMALYAITCDRQIGVDIEYHRTIANVDHLARKVLSEQEYAVFQSLDATEKPLAFLTYWTSKEAYLKAIGMGLYLATQQVEVAIAPPTLLRIAGDRHAAAQWRLVAIAPATDYVAALVVEGQDWHLYEWDYPSSGD